MTLARGTRLGSYEVIAPLGAGGMGEVYRARDKRLGREVAIKVLPESFLADRERLARFEREARLLATLNHQNIAQIYGLDGQPPFIVMELVAGDTIADRLIGNRGMPVADVLPVARQIIDALDAAHEKGIVHRDLKPANIKVTPEGVVKVLDFGLAKADDGERSASDLSQSPTITSDHTRDGVILGTASYMSPEQARGKVVDKRTDIWAFGCVLFEMLTGRRAFPGETVSDTIGAILHSEPEWNALPAGLAPRVRELLKRCLQKDARLRLRDIGDARYELDATPEITFTPSASDLPVARTALPWFIAALGVIAAAGAVGWSSFGRAAAAPTAPHLSPAVRITNTPNSEFGPAISPDGKWVAYYANANGRTDLMVKFLDSGSTLNLTRGLTMELPTRAGIGGIAISPDGSTIAFAARPDPTQAGYDTWTMPGPAGGSPRKLLGAIGSVQWSPDGKQLIYPVGGSTSGDALGIASFDGTHQGIVVPREAGRHIHWPAWSRDGRYVYFIYTYDSWHAEPAEIYRVAIGGGKPEPVVQTVRRAIYPVPIVGGGLLFAGNPNSLDLGLWWQKTPGMAPVALTNGIGEHMEMRISDDGKRVISTLVNVRQSLVSIPIDGTSHELRQVTDGFSGDLFPSVDFHTGRMVFSSSRSGHRNLWIANSDGSDATPLTTETAIDDNPAFSHDGQQIAFVSDRGGERGIWVMNAQGGAPRLLARVTALDQLAWSRDGSRIFFSRPGGDLPSLASVNVVDGRVEAVGTGGGIAPAWSPTQDILAYVDINIIPAPAQGVGTVVRMYSRFVDSKGTPLFSNTPQRSFANPITAWSPDGRKLAVVGIPANGPAELWVVEPTVADGLKKVLDFPAAVRPRGMTWTKEGDRVIVANQEFNGDIIMYELN